MIVVYILIGILVFGILIASHEFGHFITAKACGVRVDEFAVGMGPAIWKKQKGETLYALRCIPIGGYCAMAGEDSASEDPRAFTNQAPWKRILILCAGAAMNFLLGLLVVFFIYLSAWGFYVPVLTGFMEGCPYASPEGLQTGDQFWSIDGHRIYDTDDVGYYLSQGGDSYDLVLILAGLQSISKSYYEAAEIDGANGIQSFFHITIPMVSPTLFFVVLMRAMTSLKQFDTIYLLINTRNPAYKNATVLMTLFYREAFEKFNKGYGSAIVIYTFVIIAIFTAIQFISEKKLVHYE